LTLDDLRHHIAQDCSYSIKTLVRLADIVQTQVVDLHHLITQFCQRPDPADMMAPNAHALPGSSAQREHALLELSKKREQYEDLALVLWNSFGVMPSLLQEIISVYPLLSPPVLTAHASNRVCNVLALLQCVASHNDTRGPFLQAHIPLFLYPFLNTTSKSRPFEYLLYLFALR
jgi:CCR4-NOT transcription complex subunit 9